MASFSRSQFHEPNVSHVQEILQVDAVPVFVNIGVGVLDGVMRLFEVDGIRGLVGLDISEASLAVGRRCGPRTLLRRERQGWRGGVCVGVGTAGGGAG